MTFRIAFHNPEGAVTGYYRQADPYTRWTTDPTLAKTFGRRSSATSSADTLRQNLPSWIDRITVEDVDG
jgi:hypothetical protein